MGNPLLASARSKRTVGANWKLDPAARWVHHVELAEADRGRIVRALSRCIVADHACDEEGRLAVRRLAICTELEGQEHWQTVKTDGRMVRPDWFADPQKAAIALDQCQRGWGVHRSGQGSALHPYGCTSPLCPLCASQSAGRRLQRREAEAMAIAAAGCPVVHLTFTQRARGDGLRPVVLTPDEAQRFGMPSLPSGYSVSGESLHAAMERLSEAWKALRFNASSRQWWTDTVVGGLTGREFTGASKRDWRALRWHVHQHNVLMLAPGTDVQAWLARFRLVWCKVADAGPSGQHISDLSECADLRHALREVLKYPFKSWTLTNAQLVDALAVTKGLRWHLPIGALHGSSKMGKAVALLVDTGEIDPDWAPWQVAVIEGLAAARLKREEEEGTTETYYRPRFPDAPLTREGWKSRRVPAPADLRETVVPLTLSDLRRASRDMHAAKQEWTIPVLLSSPAGGARWVAVNPYELLSEVLTWKPRRRVTGPPPDQNPSG